MRSPRLPCLGLKHASGSPLPTCAPQGRRGDMGKQLVVDQQEAAPSAVFLSFLACHHSGRVAGSASWFGNGMGARLAGWAGRGGWECSCLPGKSGESSLGTKQASSPDTALIRAPVFGGLYLKLQLQGCLCFVAGCNVRQPVGTRPHPLFIAQARMEQPSTQPI